MMRRPGGHLAETQGIQGAVRDTAGHLGRWDIIVKPQHTFQVQNFSEINQKLEEHYNPRTGCGEDEKSINLKQRSKV